VRAIVVRAVRCRCFFALLGALTTPALALASDAGSGRAWAPNLPQVGPPCLMGSERVDLRPDGVFRCPALPAEVTMPTGFDIKRVEDRGGATLVTVTDGAALAFHYTVTTWRSDDPGVVTEIDQAQEQLLQMLTLVQGPKVLSHADATLGGAERGRTITFTDRQNKIKGEMRTFMIPGFGLTVVALGGDSSFVKPSGAIATAFFDSLHLVAPPAPAPLTLASGARLELPPGAYQLRDNTGGGSRQLLYLVPGLMSQIMLLDVPSSTPCDSTVREAQMPSALTSLVASAGVSLVLDGAPVASSDAVRWRGRLTRARSGDNMAGLANVGLIQCLKSRDGKGPGSLVLLLLIADNKVEVLERAREQMASSIAK
jgi:hypothetical protein